MTGHDSIHLGSVAIVDVTLPDQEVARDLLLDDDLLQAKLQTKHHHVLHLCHDSLQIDKSYCKKRKSWKIAPNSEYTPHCCQGWRISGKMPVRLGALLGVL